MSRFKKGEMHSGKSGKVVSNPKQAQAIALSSCGQSKYAESLKSMGYSETVATQVAEMLYGEGLTSGAKPKKILANA
jgi:organic hydroperoxide reductase OsmC/OhrA